jgi:hypothetical protein
VRDDLRWQRAGERLSALERRVTARDDARTPLVPRTTARGDWMVPRPPPRDQLPQQSASIAHAPMDDADVHQAPAVHVTIGRIDVRAITPPPSLRPARPHVSPRPSSSLDDYLKRRNSR